MAVFDHGEYQRWLAQAEHTLASARRDAEAGDFAWACFKAHQAGEYAVKALLRGLGRPAYGQAIRRLLQEVAALALEVSVDIQAAGQLLDRHYEPTRYPDAYPEGSPHEYYDARAAEEALNAAHQIFGWIKSVE
ncbi:MAG: HEPN domain-containing protein [Truepera sp.]|nr:HEPN domain-containing protein [Truepera sp.]